MGQVGDGDPAAEGTGHGEDRPVIAGVAVPVFALFAARRLHRRPAGLLDSPSDRVARSIVLVLGKAVGIARSAWLLHTFTRADLDDEPSWFDVIGMAMLAGIGFTVSLLHDELAFGDGSEREATSRSAS